MTICSRAHLCWLLMVLLGLQNFVRAADDAPQLAATIKISPLAPGIVTALAFSPDGETLASTGWSNNVILWNVQSRTKQKTLEELDTQGSAVAFSPDGKMVAGAGGAGESAKAVIWDARSGAVLHKFLLPGVMLTSLAFSPDNTLLAVGSGRVITISKMANFLQAGFPVLGVPDPDLPETRDQLVLGEVRIWDVQSGALQTTLSWDGQQVWSIAFAPDGKTIASGAQEEIRIWDAHSGELQKRVNASGATVTSLAFFAGGKLLAGARQNSEAWIWELETGAVKRRLKGAIPSARAISVSGDEKLLATAAPNFPVGVWDLATGQLKWSLEKETQATLAVAFSPDGRWLANGGEAGEVKLWRMK